MATVVTHSLERLCKLYGTRGVFRPSQAVPGAAHNVGLRQKGRIFWFGYSPVEGYVLINESKSPGESKYERVYPKSDSDIRKYILSDEALYAEARLFGGGGDEEMYVKLPEFIRARREALVESIDKALKTPARR